MLTNVTVGDGHSVRNNGGHASHDAKDLALLWVNIGLIFTYRLSAANDDRNQATMARHDETGTVTPITKIGIATLLSRKHTTQGTKSLTGVIALVAIMWVVFGASFVLPINELGLKPRSVSGLLGIVTMPFLHQNFGHIAGNSIPLIVLCFFVATIRAPIATVVIAIILIGGALLWLLGRSANHIGASLLVFGLSTFLIASGFYQKKFVVIVVSIVVALLYGGTLLFGVLPSSTGTSWDGHLAGAVAGIIVAKLMR